MIKTDNLYAEVVLNESPFFYDENGRLRVHSLNEESIKKEPEEMKAAVMPSEKEPSVEAKPLPEPVPSVMKKEKTPEQKAERKEIKKVAKAEMRAGRSKEQITQDIKQKSAARMDAIRGELKNLKKTDPEAYKARIDKARESIAARKAAKAAPVPAKKPANDGGMMRTADMQDRDLDGTDDRDQKPTGGLKKLPAKPGMGGGLKKLPAKPGMESGLKKLPAKPGMGGGLKKLPAPAKPGMGEKKPLRSFRFSKGSVAGAGKNTNTRAGLRGVQSNDRAMMEDSRPAIDYIEEKMNVKKAEMGEVIKDFQKSDAPQFKGKSKEKRRIMAIAAKLQADRGE